MWLVAFSAPMVEVMLEAPAKGRVGTFEVTLTYEVPFPQYARVAVFERGDDIPGITHFSSVEVYLRP